MFVGGDFKNSTETDLRQKPESVVSRVVRPSAQPLFSFQDKLDRVRMGIDGSQSLQMTVWCVLRGQIQAKSRSVWKEKEKQMLEK